MDTHSHILVRRQRDDAPKIRLAIMLQALTNTYNITPTKKKKKSHLASKFLIMLIINENNLLTLILFLLTKKKKKKLKLAKKLHEL